MRAAIMQPYFFPYLGYWQLMAACDQWIFFDQAQFNKRSWMTRNRILHTEPGREFQYINLATEKVTFGQSILETHVKQESGWRNKILSQLEIYKELDAPYYSQVIELVEKILFSNAGKVADQAEIMAREVMNYLGLDINLRHSSKIDFDTEKVKSAGDWALEISKSIGASAYINPPNGAGIFDQRKFKAAGIELIFLKSGLPEYKQSNREFTEGLSILDVLMFNSTVDVVSMLKKDFQFFDQASLI